MKTQEHKSDKEKTRGNSNTKDPKKVQSLIQLKDNRKEAAVQRQLQKMADDSEHSKRIAQLKSLSKDHPIKFEGTVQRKVFQLMGEDEQGDIEAWFTGTGKAYLRSTAPDMITDAALSKAVRLRWFGVTISGKKYNIGVNLHYNNGGVGGIWAKNLKTKEAHEMHPKKPPQHGYDGNVEFELAQFVKEVALKDKIHPPVK